ncbi:heme lyase NrfEFG subunit NrfF [Escherichia coli]|nr:heme lyase NrfEFG subunit NrfF [Escherichia coli]
MDVFLPEVGFLALLLSLGVNVLTPLTAFAGVRLRWPAMMRLTCIGILAQFALLLLAFGVLTYCFLISDFSVIYVAQHSYSLLSWELKLAAEWGGHEGSLLLWVLLLSAWSALFAWHYRQQTDPLFPLTLAVLSLMLATLLLFVVLWSDPFVRIFPPAIEGRDLNPMLQHPGLIFHPPLLYLGYGGLMVAASVALASLLRGEFDGTCARICWRWALPGWSALTAGIILGSWWAYCELGWGGWWFWDPVENASLLPWLSATALLLLFTCFARAQVVDTWQFANPQQQEQALNIASQLRCPQCQNQNLLESNAPVAVSMRHQVYTMVEEGKSEVEIIGWMTERYGDFVRYNPPLTGQTLVLWALPVVLLLLMALILWRVRAKR